MKNKIRVVFVGISILFLSVIVRAVQIQVIKRNKLITYSNSQVKREIKSYPERGHILDRNGNPLAINIKSFDLFTYPITDNQMSKKLDELERVVPQLNFAKLRKTTMNRSGKFTWLGRKVDINAQQLELLKTVEGVNIRIQASRLYPNHELASQVLGFVGVDNDGLSGLEYEFNDDLKGKAVIERYSKDAKGRKIKSKQISVPGKAHDLILSIDKDIQASLETYLKEGVLESDGESGGAAVMDAETGEIWAMANYPSFDPNDVKNTKLSERRLSFVSDQFEPGSTFKTLTIASALEHNIVKPDTNYYCEKGKYLVGNHYISESDNKHAFEWLSVEDILKYSSNIGTTKIAFDLTYPNLKKTLDKFKIGVRTGIENPGEAKGSIDKKGNISPLRLSNISFGQGVATTGIQMLAAYAAIANDGKYVVPTIVKGDHNKSKAKRIISVKTARILQEMLVKAVEEGTGQNAMVKHFKIAGKTSTAQAVDKNGGYVGYNPGFIGFPLNVGKKFVVYTYVKKPKKAYSYYGSTVAAPIFQKIVKSILYKRKEYNQLASVSTGKKNSIDEIRFKQSAKRTVVKGIVPNLIGLDKSSAFHLLDKSKIKYTYRGFGVVHSQSPRAGDPLPSDTEVKLKFKTPSYE
jgi:cell division protein FtsI (penicillin-binding protein 3)